MAEKKKSPPKIATKKFHPSKYVDVSPTLERSIKSKAMLTMGDFSPPSIADQRLVESLKKYAKLAEADTLVFVLARDVSEGYLNEHQRIQMSQSVFGEVVYPEAISSIEEALKLCESEYLSVTIVCMEEDVADVSSTVKSLRDQMRYESIEVVPYGDPQSHDVIAEHVIANDFTAFKQALAMPIRPYAKEVFDQMTSMLDVITEGYLEERIRPIPYAERIKRAQTMRRYAKRIEIARERAAQRRASPEKIRERARKRALEIIRSRILRNKKYADLSVVEKNVLDSRLMNIPPAVIERIAKRMLPVVRQAETERMSHKHGHVSLTASSTGHHGHVNEAFTDFQTINELHQLIEAVESTNMQRARSSINAEKKSDALRHHRMVVTAKKADINKQASSEFANIQKRMNEVNDAVQSIIQRELERKKMLSAAKDYEATPDAVNLSRPEMQTRAKDVISRHDLDPSKYADLMKMYDRYVISKGHDAYLNTFDVTESTEEDNTPSRREWGTDSLTDIYKKDTPGQIVQEKHEPKGLWYNIRKRREKGLRKLRPGEKGYPKTLNIDK